VRFTEVRTKTAIREYIGISAKSMLFPTLCSAASIGLHAYKISGVSECLWWHSDCVDADVELLPTQTYDAIAVFSVSKLSLISILHLTLA